MHRLCETQSYSAGFLLDISICFYCDLSFSVIGRRNVLTNTGRFLGITVGVLFTNDCGSRINIENARGILAPVRAALPGMCPLMSFRFHSYCTDSLGVQELYECFICSRDFYFYGSYETKDSALLSPSRRSHGAISRY